MRRDISLAAQIVQVGHACLEAGRRFPQPDEPCSLVVLSVPDEPCLLALVEGLRLHGIQLALFYEPDAPVGYTAACSEPLSRSARRLFRRLPLWREDVAQPPERAPPAG